MAIRAMFSVQNALSTPSGLAGLLCCPLALAMTVAAVPEIFNEIQLNARAGWKGTCAHTSIGCASVCVCAGNSLHLNNWKIHTLGYWIGRKPNRQRAHKCIYGAILNYKNCRTDSRLGLPAELCMFTPPPCAPVDLCIYLKIICLQCTGNGATASVRKRALSLCQNWNVARTSCIFKYLWKYNLHSTVSREAAEGVWRREAEEEGKTTECCAVVELSVWVSLCVNRYDLHIHFYLTMYGITLYAPTQTRQTDMFM